MKLNHTQLRIIGLISQKMELSISDISNNVKIGPSITYKYVKELMAGGLLDKKEDEYKYIISSNVFARILSNMLMEDDTLIEVLANEGIPILMSLVNRENIGINQLAKETGLSPSSVYPYIRKYVKRQIINKIKGNLIFNKELWGKLHQFISFYKSYSILSQFKKVPTNAKIYFESPYEIIFSLKIEVDFAIKTAFSVYDKYGIGLAENEIFYRIDNLHKRKLDIQTVFLDSLRIAGAKNEESSRRRLYCYLFYKKNINYLRKARHPDLEILNKIIIGEISREEGFPMKNEIIEKGKEYDLQI